MQLTEEDYNEILQRYEWDMDYVIDHCLRALGDKNCLVTGASGSLGTWLMQKFDERDINYTGIDIVPSDTHYVEIVSVLDYAALSRLCSENHFDYIFHFAADKHAPHGEDNPLDTVQVNILGTENVIKAAHIWSSQPSKIIFSSTCKACDPETVYGATKMICERYVLNAGHSVARYYNVIETSGNVFEIWERTPPEDHKVMNCYRYFITVKESIALTLFTAIAPSGRYAINVGNASYMPDVYHALYHGSIPVSEPRRGDRVVEPRVGKHEERVPTHVSGIVEVINYHDATAE